MIALFRLVEVESGRITIDGVDLSTLGLRLLRQRVAMIPQEPVILEGTARSNIDPFNQRTDDECETALASVGLHASLLNQRISADASLSIGERQLLAIARVLVRGAKVVCMDEPTAHVDAATDAQIQNVVKTQFNHSTFLTIAHRLHTIIDYDKTLVLDAGRVVQFGTPSALLDDDDGPFAQMVNHLGPNTKAKLREKATGSAE